MLTPQETSEAFAQILKKIPLSKSVAELRENISANANRLLSGILAAENNDLNTPSGYKHALNRVKRLQNAHNNQHPSG